MAAENFEILRRIDSGGFSQVYISHHIPTGEQLAVKVQVVKPGEDKVALLRELTLLKSARADLFPQLKYSFLTTKDDVRYHCMAMEFCRGKFVLCLKHFNLI